MCQTPSEKGLFKILSSAVKMGNSIPGSWGPWLVVGFAALWWGFGSFWWVLVLCVGVLLLFGGVLVLCGGVLVLCGGVQFFVVRF